METQQSVMLQQHMQQTIRREQLLSPDDVVLVAFSGGADSAALLHALCAWRDAGGVADVKAAHIHHGLRGAEADADEQAVRRMCADLGVQLFCHHADVAALAAEQKRGIEETGRDVRYAFLQKTAAFLGAKIATAHTLNDQAETVLLHLARGCGLRGLAGIPFKRDNVVRPLLDCTRAQVEAYCQAHRLPYVTDRTNMDTDYARNRLRMQAVPALLSTNEAALRNIAHLSACCREDDAYLDGLATAFIEEHTSHPTREAMCALAPSIRKRVFAKLALRNGISTLSYRHQEQLSRSAEQGCSVSVSGDKTAVWQGKPQRLYWTQREVETSTDAVPLYDGETVNFAGQSYRFSIVSVAELKKYEKINKKVLNYTFDCDKICGSLWLRSRQTGDYFHEAGRAGGKTVKKWMIERGIPAHMRECVPVVCDECGVVLVVGYGCDARVTIDEQTDRIGCLLKLDENFQ